MTKRALLFATTYFPLVGGAEVAMKELTDRLPEWQFDLVCAKIQGGLASTQQIGNVTVHRVGFGLPMDKFLLPLLGPLTALRIQGSKAAVVWSLMASYGGFAALVYTWLRPKAKLLLTLQEGDPLEHYAKRAGRFQFLHKRIFVRANTVQAISRFLAEWATTMGFTGTPVVIPNGVDIDRFSRSILPERHEELRRDWNMSESDTVLVTTSRLSLKNGVDDLIRSLAFLDSSYKLVIAGDGEDLEKLTSLVRELELGSRVRFLGKRGHDALPEILHASDVFVRASLSEGLGNSFLEAMAAGLPIVGTPVGGIPDFLTDGETGVFCEPRNPESIARAVRRIQEEWGLREKLVRQGVELVRSRFDWTGIARRMNELLSSLV
jgi:glycosyltransferase involved in cell wall biosynthesis